VNITPDNIVFWQWGWGVVNLTMVMTWVLMAVLVLLSWLATRRLDTGPRVPRWQNFMEAVVDLIMDQIEEVTGRKPYRFLPMLGTLALFVGLSNLLTIVPGYEPPTGSLSTTAALALIVFVMVPVYGIGEIGVRNYLKNYTQPNIVMLPFNIIGELSRTLALAIRLFGNIMSGKMIVGILLSLSPLFFPIIMRLLGLLTGVVQAFIFFILAAVYVGANMDVKHKKQHQDA
jgi:F-type H+-transporting ATPase subunit a